MNEEDLQPPTTDLFLLLLLIFLCLPVLITILWKELLCMARYGEHKWETSTLLGTEQLGVTCVRCEKFKY